MDRKCATCNSLRPRKPSDVNVGAEYRSAEHWCAKNDMPTCPELLRCGGDDWTSKPTPMERKADRANLEFALFEFQKRHGSWEATQWLVGALVKGQKESNLTKSTYEGQDFKLSITTRK